MAIERLAVDASVNAVFPATKLVEELADAPVAVGTTTGESDEFASYDAVVTLAHREAYLDLDWVHSIQAGVDRFPAERFRAAGVMLTNSAGIHGDAVGETVAAYVLAVARRLHVYVGNQTRSDWSAPAWDEAWTVTGERACVIGLGSLGRGIVDRLRGLGLEVDAVRRNPIPEPGVSRVYQPADLHEAVAAARFVILAVPLTDETEGLIDAGALEAMREDAYLINVARGRVVDQDALTEAVKTGEIAGAALDVFEEEPLPTDSPLWQMEEVIVSPHAASLTSEYYRHVAAIVRESLQRLAAGDEPVNRVL